MIDIKDSKKMNKLIYNLKCKKLKEIWFLLLHPSLINLIIILFL
jgi:hypothetical protein